MTVGRAAYEIDEKSVHKAMHKPTIAILLIDDLTVTSLMSTKHISGLRTMTVTEKGSTALWRICGYITFLHSY